MCLRKTSEALVRKKRQQKNNKSILRTLVGILAELSLLAMLAVICIFVILLVWFSHLISVLLNLLLGERILLMDVFAQGGLTCCVCIGLMFDGVLSKWSKVI